MVDNTKPVYEKPILVKHAQLREVTLASIGSTGGNNNGNNGNGNGNGGGNGSNGNGNGNGNQ